MEISVALSLVTALYTDDSEFGAAQRVKLAALLAEKPSVPGIVERLVATPKSDGGFDWANSNITDANFPATAEPSLEGARLDKIVGSKDYVLAELKRLGRRAATAAEGLLYGIKNPGEQRKYWIWCLAQVWLDPDSRGGYAVVLGVRDDGKRILFDGRTGEPVSAVERVLSFPL